MERLYARMCHVKIEYFQNYSWLPTHPLSSLNVEHFFASKLMYVIQHSLYSPDLAPTDSPPPH